MRAVASISTRRSTVTLPATERRRESADRLAVSQDGPAGRGLGWMLRGVEEGTEVESPPVVIVTGAGSGIGRATAELFLHRGYGVVVVDVDDRSLAWAAHQSGVCSVVGDVSDAATNGAMVEAAVRNFGRLDVAVLNAGVVGSPPIEADGAIERLDRILAVNVRGVALGIRFAAPAMRSGGGGSIVATASTSGLRADPGSWAYNSSKAAVINLVRAAALDYAVQSIRVNAVAPGPTATGMTLPLRQARPEVFDDITSRVPMQRMGQPPELAEAIFFLASPAASFITGVTLPVDGGISANAGHFPPMARDVTSLR
jgi:meso-butanediol dehydrogenase/(S,S)-butanediol dehydrogenase/diacetyl reductase